MVFAVIGYILRNQVLSCQIYRLILPDFKDTKVFLEKFRCEVVEHTGSYYQTSTIQQCMSGILDLQSMYMDSISKH